MEKIIPKNGKINFSKMEMHCLKCTLKILEESESFLENYSFDEDLGYSFRDARENIEAVLNLIKNDSITFNSDPHMG